MVLLGPSGCGKTTLLRLIAGFEQPDAGAILIDGRDVTDTPPGKRGLAMVFQSYALFPHLKVFDNIAFGLRMHHVGRDELQRRVGNAAELMQITRFLDRMSEIRISETHHGPIDARRYTYDSTHMMRGVTELHLVFTPVE